MTSEFAKLFKTLPLCQYFNNTTSKLSSFRGLGEFILKLGVDPGGGAVSPVLWLLQRRKAKHRLQNKFRRLALSSSRLSLDYLGDQWRSHLPHHHPNPECTGGPHPPHGPSTIINAIAIPFPSWPQQYCREVSQHHLNVLLSITGWRIFKHFIHPVKSSASTDKPTNVR